MPYLIEGTARDIYTAFGRSWMLAPSTDNGYTLKKDLSRFHFIGAKEQLKELIPIMQDSYQTNANSYTQGNISAGNLKLLFGELPLMEEEDISQYMPMCEVLDYAFIDEDQRACGLMLLFRKDKPDKWIIGLIQNTNETPEKRRVILLGNEAFHPLSAQALARREGKIAYLEHNQLLESINNDVLRYFIKHAIGHRGVNIQKVHRIKLIALHSDDHEHPNDLSKNPRLIKRLLTEDNEVLDRLAHYNVQLSAKHLKECLDKNSPLYSLLLDKTSKIKDEDRAKDFIPLLVALHETGPSKTNQNLLNNPLFLRNLEPILNIGYPYLLTILKNPRLLSFILQLMTSSQFSNFLTESQEKKFELPDYLFELYAQASSDWLREALLCFYMADPSAGDKQRLTAFYHVLSQSEKQFQEIGSGNDLMDLLNLDDKDNVLNHLNGLLNQHIKPLLKELNAPLTKTLFRKLLKIHIEEQNPDIIKLIPQCLDEEKITLLNQLRQADLNPKTIQAIFDSEKILQCLVNLPSHLSLTELMIKLDEETFLNVLDDISRLETKRLQNLAFIFLADEINITQETRLLQKLRENTKLCNFLCNISVEKNAEELSQMVFNPQRWRAEEVYEKFKQLFTAYHFNKESLNERSIDSLNRLSKRLSILKKLRIDNKDLFKNFLNNGAQCKRFIELEPFITLLSIQARDLFVPLLLEATANPHSRLNIEKLKLSPDLSNLAKWVVAQIKHKKSLNLRLDQHQEITQLIYDPALSAYSLPLLSVLLKHKKQAQALSIALSLLTQIERAPDYEVKDKAIVLTILLNHLNHRRTPSTADQIANIHKPQLRSSAQNMIHCFDLIMILQKLELPPEALKFVTDTSVRGFQFRRIISRVESECHSLERRLERASNSEDKLAALSTVKDGYRRDLYTLAYEHLSNQIDESEFTAKLGQAQNKINQAVNIDRHPYLRKFAMVLGNIVISCCSLGLANLIHQRKTGDCFFFTKPKSAEAIEKLNRDVAKFGSKGS